MVKALTIPAYKFDEANLDYNLISTLVYKHKSTFAPQLIKNKEYYNGKHSIENKERTNKYAPNTKIVCNHAAYISDSTSNYFMGNPIVYKNTDDADIEPLLKAFDNAFSDDADMLNSLNMAIYGVSYELEYVKKDTNELSIKVLNPETTFLVVDDSIEENPLFVVYYRIEKDDSTGFYNCTATVYTESFEYNYVIKDYDSKDRYLAYQSEPVEHFMGSIPVVEFRNNKDGFGDFEKQISLIDGYNMIMSDSIDDIEKFIDNILVLKMEGSLNDDNAVDVDGNPIPSPLSLLKKERILQIEREDSAEFINNSLDQAGIEILRRALEEKIFTLSFTPNLDDKNFASNSSGVAMKYKLIGMEYLTKTKERFYRAGIRQRIKNFCYYLGLTQIELDANSIIPVFSRSLPQDYSEIANMVSTLEGIVSKKTLIAQLPFIEDVEKEIELLNEEKTENIENNKKLFGTEEDPLKDPEEKSEGEQEEEEEDKEEKTDEETKGEIIKKALERLGL